MKNSTYKSTKLCQTFFTKERYVIHFNNLKQYLDLGLKVVKVHKMIKFKQSNWLHPYIDFNGSMQAKATDSFSKDFYKLMNYAVFGKLMEDVRKHKDIK